MITPVNDVHSIKAVALVLEFPSEIGAGGLSLVREEAKRFRSKLNMRRVIRSLNIPFPVLDNSDRLHEEESGYRYFIRKPDGAEAKWFEVAGSRAVFCTNEYTDFNSFWAEAKYFLDIGRNAFGVSGSKAEKLTLEYRDEFTSPDISWEPAELFNGQSELLSKRAVQQSKYWHSHYGFFDELEGRESLNLGKINHVRMADSFDGSYFSQVDITLTHGVALVPGDELDGLVYSLKSVHKDHITDILSDNMLNAIGLRTGS
ncbi:hypothetical protein EF096_15855 [Pseudomonas neustonica]|uniref:TIGR04255 family protein n=1 Tax=Pseudomonas neustonica TaxID=2487346 RepID=A0ABX9XH63_9PSED|nr:MULTISPECIES: hypothetical protein [Pseudomonas]ROZ80935.1 hypothetical protein EF099_16320 [Pseudomonas sp. SSM44]ROZ82133.1 hypothetical protein EF096_15855 [Pseudomonas neustonica]